MVSEASLDFNLVSRLRSRRRAGPRHVRLDVREDELRQRLLVAAALRLELGAHGLDAVEGDLSKIVNFCKIFTKFCNFFGGLVLSCIKTKFCKKICV